MRDKSTHPRAMEAHEGHLHHTAPEGDGLVNSEQADQQPGGEQGGIADAKEGKHTQEEVHGGVEGGAGLDDIYEAQVAHQSHQVDQQKVAKRSCFWPAWSVRPSRMHLGTVLWFCPEAIPLGCFLPDKEEEKQER